MTGADQVQQLAAALFEPADIVEVRVLPMRRSRWYRADQLEEGLNDVPRGQGVFFGANPRRAIGGSETADVLLARSVFADFDATPLEHAQAAWAAAGLGEPTAIVASGHGVHGYWRLDTALDDLERWSALQSRLATALRSDPVVKDPPRIMRLPGTTNYKDPARPVPCVLVSADPARVYALDEIESLLPPAIARTTAAAITPAAARAEVLQLVDAWPGVVAGWRNKEGFSHALELVRHGAGDDDGIAALQTWNARNAEPLPPDELATIWGSARKYNAAHPRPADTLPDAPPAKWRSFGEVVSDPRYRAGLPAISCGLETLDEALGGLRAESMTTVAGRTGTAKSCLVLTVARLVALSGTPVLVYRLEESDIEGAMRVHAAGARVPLSALLAGAGNADEATRAALIDAWGILHDIPLYFSAERRVGALVQLGHEFVATGGGLLIVDQLSHIHVDDTEPGYTQATKASDALRRLARDTRVPVVAVVQVGREASKKSDRLSVNDLRDSGQIENDSAAVVLIDKTVPPVVNRGPDTPYGLELLIAKNRYGATTKSTDPPLLLDWWPRLGLIRDHATPTLLGRINP